MTTLVIGGGLSGLALAEMLEARGRDYLMIEARDHFGGRIMTEFHGAGYLDMGPAWFWPGQPRIVALIDRLGLQRFEQFTNGLLTFEDEQGRVERGRGFASMQGSWRLSGGMAALTQAIAEGLPENRKRLGAQVVQLCRTKQGVRATLSNGELLEADEVVLAMPPRIAAKITYIPALPDLTLSAMQSVPTWMAGQAKAVAVYETPFWRADGLSGDAMSCCGPMVEVHDASPARGGPFGLFGFIGVPPRERQDEQVLRKQLLAQLERLFGKKAAEPLKLYVKDWAIDPLTATPADHAPLYAHPTYTLPKAMQNLWNGKLHFAGTEVAPQFGGYLEGALEAAENVMEGLGMRTARDAYAN